MTKFVVMITNSTNTFGIEEKKLESKGLRTGINKDVWKHIQKTEKMLLIKRISSSQPVVTKFNFNIPVCPLGL